MLEKPLALPCLSEVTPAGMKKATCRGPPHSASSPERQTQMNQSYPPLPKKIMNFTLIKVQCLYTQKCDLHKP